MIQIKHALFTGFYLSLLLPAVFMLKIKLTGKQKQLFRVVRIYMALVSQSYQKLQALMNLERLHYPLLMPIMVTAFTLMHYKQAFGY